MTEITRQQNGQPAVTIYHNPKCGTAPSAAPTKMASPILELVGSSN